MDEGGLASTYFTCHDHEPLAFFYGINQVGQGLSVAFAKIQKMRIWGKVEGLFLQVKEFLIHSITYIECCGSPKG